MVDLVVGIDVGMSGTGVAYSRGGVGAKVESLDWGNKEQPKVRTRLAYDTRDRSMKLLGWGSDIPDSYRYVHGIVIEEWFKTNLGQKGVDQDHVERLYTDYLTCLYDYVSQRFTSEGIVKRPWESAAIHFVFSAPATWNPKVVNTFRALAAKAGFDKFKGHSITVSVTEPEAVAAFELRKPKSQFQAGDNVLIVDAGGGTCDFCLLRIEDGDQGRSQAFELRPVIGDEIGSTYIDGGFQRLATSLLEQYATQLDYPVEYVAWELCNGDRFQELKHNFRPFRTEDQTIEVPGLAGAKEIVLGGEQLKALFDEQVQLMESRIGDLVGNLCSWAQANPTHSLDYLLLSGGLGSSQYVSYRLGEFCANSQIPLLEATRVVLCSEPRLSVCMGIVQHALSNIQIFPRFPSKASFGIACRIPYKGRPVEERWNENQTQAYREKREAVKDGFKMKWFDDCIDWFIKKGAEVPESRVITSRHSAIFHPDDQQRNCIVEILVTLEAEPSPFKSKETSGAQTHMSLQVDLSRVKNHVQIINDRRHHRVFGKKAYIQVDFVIKANIGLAEANFQCFEIGEDQALSVPLRVDVNKLQPICQGLAELEV